MLLLCSSNSSTCIYFFCIPFSGLLLLSSVSSTRLFFRIPFSGASTTFVRLVYSVLLPCTLLWCCYFCPLHHIYSSLLLSAFPSRVCFFCIPFSGPAILLSASSRLLGSSTFRIPFLGPAILSSVSSTRIYFRPSSRLLVSSTFVHLVYSYLLAPVSSTCFPVTRPMSSSLPSPSSPKKFSSSLSL